MVSSGHCCVYFFRLSFGVPVFTCGSLLFLSFVFVRGASVLRADSLVEGLSSLTHAKDLNTLGGHTTLMGERVVVVKQSHLAAGRKDCSSLLPSSL